MLEYSDLVLRAL